MINRRDFLKLVSTTLLSFMLSPAISRARNKSGKKNVLIVVFDALSACDIPFHGYPRNTMPNLSRIIDNAIVFHNHRANGNYTTPGTASLLTGTLPWNHRAFSTNGTVREDKEIFNIFYLFSNFGYDCFACTHNPLAEIFLVQFEKYIKYLIPRQELFLSQDIYNKLFKFDSDIAELSRHQAFEDINTYTGKYRYAESIFFHEIYQKISTRFREKSAKEYLDDFPRGLPRIWKNDYFTLENAIDRLITETSIIPEPFMGYFHFLPPHYPYTPRKEFSELFKEDNFKMRDKPDHLFSNSQTYKESKRNRLLYNQHIAYADAEFARLYKYLEVSGLLNDTLLVFTSDHGEMFERGVIGHRTNCLHEPILRVPLIIFDPNQTSRQDIFSPTSSIDVLPTLLHLTGQKIPDWIEGDVLPPFKDAELIADRSSYSIQAHDTGKWDPLTKASIAMIKNQYKLHAYFGYDQLSPGETLYELYDLKKDPDELNNLYTTGGAISIDLVAELQEKIKQVNKPFI